MLDNEIANYSTLVYPPASAHAVAEYGPAPNAFSGVALNGSDPTPLETVLASGHPIAIVASPEDWNEGAPGATITATGGALTSDHVVPLVGYDSVNQIFRIKNSWGTDWQDGGFANLSYPLDPSIFPPGNCAPTGVSLPPSCTISIACDNSSVPPVWSLSPPARARKEDWNYAIGEFEGLPEFFARAASEGRHVIFTVDQ